MSILKDVRAKAYEVDNEALRSLIRMRNGSTLVTEQSDTDYFRVLVQRMQQADALTAESVKTAFERINTDMFGVVKSVVITKDIEADPKDTPDEKARKTLIRQRRTAFARSAASELRTWLTHRGREGLMNLNPLDVHKSQIQWDNKQSRKDMMDPHTEALRAHEKWMRRSETSNNGGTFYKEAARRLRKAVDTAGLPTDLHNEVLMSIRKTFAVD